MSIDVRLGHDLNFMISNFIIILNNGKSIAKKSCFCDKLKMVF